ncbi:MAG: glycosyltransferase family 9 protein [bacterium]
MKWIRKPNGEIKLPDGRPPRLLAVQIAGIGDLVLATPALSALRERFPEARIDVLTSPRAANLLAGHPAVSNVYFFDIGRFRNPLSLLVPGMLYDLRNQTRPLRESRYDALLSLNNVSTRRGALTLGLLLRSLEVPVWVGRNTDGRMSLFDGEVRESSADPVPEALTKLKVASLLGADPAPRPLVLPVSREERERALRLLEQPGEWAAIMPGANVSHKRWPVERFAEIAVVLRARGMKIMVLGAKDDIEVAAHVTDAVAGNARDLAGRVTLRETAALLQACRVAVTNDTGPMHIAAAVGTPLVALFASVNVVRFRPWTADNRCRTLTSPCGSEYPESDPRAMEASLRCVGVPEVLGAVDEMLEEA